MPKITILDTEQRWDFSSEDEFLWWPRVTWIDPGVVSGVATVWFDPQALYDQKPLSRVLLAYSEIFLSGPESGLNGQVNRFLRIRRHLSPTEEPGNVVGCESFVLRRLDQDDELLAPVRIRAALDFALSKVRPDGAEQLGNGVQLFVQSPNDALNAFNNERLKHYRMYTPGPDHINDAKRHALLFIRKLIPMGPEQFKLIFGNEEEWWNNEQQEA